MKSVAILGAGVAGLVGALAFARKGVRSIILERTATLQEVGAGLQLSPNATYVLDQLGVADRLEGLWREPDNICLVSGQTLAPITSIATKSISRSRWGSPYASIHRATLQKILLERVQEEPLISLHLDTECKSEEEVDELAGGRPDLTVGADGVWSKFRQFVPQSGSPEFTGMVAWRFIIPERDAPSFLNPRNVTAYVGSNAHIVAYPLKDAGAFNVVALSAGKNPGETWAADCNPTFRNEMTAQFSTWHRDIRTLLAYAPKPTWWPLFGVSHGRWTDGQSRVLIGDAAHAMTPFLGHGAACGIEDAVVLARALAASDSAAEGLARYEKARHERATFIQQESNANADRMQGQDTDLFGLGEMKDEESLGLFTYDPRTAEI